MIAEIQGSRGPEYVALHLDERTREPVWVPIRGDRGRTGEIDKITAIGMCVSDLQEQIEPLVEASREMHKLHDRRGRSLTADEQQRAGHLAREIAEAFERAWANLARLLDAPTGRDRVEVEANYKAARRSRGHKQK